ncbi:MAG TPA: phosphotransferase [Streptosporangiaceae bacterium]|nr:phosphotransferase [Streptosporangiaceae bacterium]
MTTAVCGGAGLTADFLTAALARHLDGTTITGVQADPVGTGQVSDSYRLRLTYDGPAGLPPTLIAKVPAADPASRTAARTFRTYEIEACFYDQIAPGLPVALARCYYAAYDADPDEYIVLLEDLHPAAPGDQLAGLHPQDAAAAVAEMAALHAAGWDSPELAAMPWLNRSSPEAAALLAAAIAALYPGFRQRYAERLEQGTLTLIEDFLPHAGSYLTAADEPRTIVHGDFRADNLLFGRDRPVVLDWQTASYGAATGDLSYFLGSSLPVATRRQYEEALVRRYHSGLQSGGVELSWHDCWTGYRRHAFSGIVMDIIAAMFVQQTDRGDKMFTTMARRHARHALDLDALGTL